MDCEESDVQSSHYSIMMDDAPTGLSNYFEAVVEFLLKTNQVPKKRKDKRSLAEISATTSDENNPPRENIRHRAGGKVGT